MNNHTEGVEPSPRIYVVKEDESLGQFVSDVLHEHGFRGRELTSVRALLGYSSLDGPGCLVVSRRLTDDEDQELRTLEELLATVCRSLPVIVFTEKAGVRSAVRLMERGALSVLERSCQPQDLIDAIKRALRRSEVEGRISNRFQEVRSAFQQLSEREKLVLRAIAAGQVNKAIAGSLEVSLRTVEGDRAKIFNKFSVSSTGEAVSKYAQYRLLTEMGYPDLDLKGVFNCPA